MVGCTAAWRWFGRGMRRFWGLLTVLTALVVSILWRLDAWHGTNTPPDPHRRTVDMHTEVSTMPLASVFSWSPTHVHASTTALHEQVQLTATNTASVANMTMQAAELARVNCVQNHTYRAFGWRERGPLFYLRGCNREAVIDFEGWSRRTGCPKMAVEELLIHVGWTGPWLPHFLPDMFGLLDSFLATQDTPRTKLIFWLMDRKPDPAKDEIVRRYAAISDGAIQFRFANVTELQVGTCIAANPAMWSPPGKIQPQVKSDLLRILLLHKFGGVWVDTDTILLRDIRPLVAFFGEFGGKFAVRRLKIATARSERASCVLGVCGTTQISVCAAGLYRR